MTIKTHVQRPESGGTVARIHGEFGASDVDHLLAVTIDVEVDGPVAVDFHNAVAVDDSALIMFAMEFSGRAGHGTLVGLSEHHHRLLRYIGLSKSATRHGDAD